MWNQKEINKISPDLYQCHDASKTQVAYPYYFESNGLTESASILGFHTRNPNSVKSHVDFRRSVVFIRKAKCIALNVASNHWMILFALY